MNEMFSARPIASTVKRTYRRHQADQRVKDTQTGCQSFDSESDHQHAGNAARQRIGGDHWQWCRQSVRNSRFGRDRGTDHNGATGGFFSC